MRLDYIDGDDGHISHGLYATSIMLLGLSRSHYNMFRMVCDLGPRDGRSTRKGYCRGRYFGVVLLSYISSFLASTTYVAVCRPNRRPPPSSDSLLSTPTIYVVGVLSLLLSPLPKLPLLG